MMIMTSEVIILLFSAKNVCVVWDSLLVFNSLSPVFLVLGKENISQVGYKVKGREIVRVRVGVVEFVPSSSTY